MNSILEIRTDTPALPFCRFRLKAPKPRPNRDSYPKELKTWGDHIRKKRLDLGLLQAGVASHLQVNETTIYLWESNRVEPSVRMLPGIIRFLGYVPYNPAASFAEWLKACRHARGLSQEQLAKSLGVDESTVNGGEAERHTPTRFSLDTIKKLVNNL